MTPHEHGTPDQGTRPAAVPDAASSPTQSTVTDTHARLSPTWRSPTGARALVRRRWPVALGAAVLLLVLTVFLFRRGSGDAAETAPATKTKAAAGADSIITLDSMAQRIAGIQLVTAGASASDELLANGTITFDANRVSIVAPRTEGRVARVLADLGQEVRAGQILATIESPDVGQTRGDLDRARSAVSIAQRNYEREKRLFEEQISPQKEMLDAEREYRSAEADYRTALSKLQSFGASSGVGSTYGLRSAVAGTVVERNASPGQIVGPNANVFTVADLNHVWITVDAYETDLKRIHPGAAATVSVTALPGETFKGRVTFAGGVVDTASRTVKLRVLVENEGRRLRPGMFAQVRIAAPSGTPTSGAVALPEVAIQDVNGKPTVFVSTAPGRFVARTVTVGERAGNGATFVTGGVRSGERVVVQGAFQLKSELMKASLGED